MAFQRMGNSNVKAFFSPLRGDVLRKIIIIIIIIIITMIITKAIITLTIIMKFGSFPSNSRPEGYSKKHTAKILQNLQRNTSAELSF